MTWHHLAVALAGGLLLAGCPAGPDDYPARTPPAGWLTDPLQQNRGQQLFARLCASCHGHPSEGRSPRADFFVPPAPDFSERRYRSGEPAYLYWRIETGKHIEPFRSRGSVMPAWGAHLSSAEIWQLVAYLRVRADGY